MGSKPACPRPKDIEQHGFLAEALKGTRRELSQVITQLRRAMGITPSSERSSDDPIGAIKQADEANSDGLDNKNKKKKEKHAQEKPSEKSERLCKWHRCLANRHSRKAKKQKANEAKMKVEDIELSIAVGMTLTLSSVGHPPHRSQRAELPHWALAAGRDLKAQLRPLVGNSSRG